MRSSMKEQSSDWLVALGYPLRGTAFSLESDVDQQPTLALAASLENCQVHLNLA